MRTYMARLGSFQFGMDTAAFQDLQRSSAYRWEAKNRIGRQPAMQNTGRNADTISLSGTIYPHWRGGLGQIGALRDMAATGEPFPLVYAFETSGQYCGLWCIESIDETRTAFLDGGAPRKIDFKLTLKEYGEDAGLSEQLPAFAADVADVLDSEDVTDQVDADDTQDQAEEMEAEVEQVQTQPEAVAILPKVAATAQEVTSAISGGINKVLNSDAMRMAKTAVATVSQLKTTAANLQGSVKVLQAAINNPANLVSALGTMSNAASAATDVMRSTTQKLGITAPAFNGASPASLHSRQIASSIDAVNKFASAAESIGNTANKLKGLV